MIAKAEYVTPLITSVEINQEPLEPARKILGLMAYGPQREKTYLDCKPPNVEDRFSGVDGTFFYPTTHGIQFSPTPTTHVIRKFVHQLPIEFNFPKAQWCKIPHLPTCIG